MISMPWATTCLGPVLRTVGPSNCPNEFRLIARLLHSKHMCLHYKDQLFDAAWPPLRIPHETRNCGDWAECGVTFGILTAILWCRLVELYRRFGGTSSETLVLFIKLHGVTPWSMAAFKIEGS